MIASLLDRPVRRAALAAGSCLVVAGALAACGSSASGDSAAASSSQGADGFAAYRQCLSEHGITLPSGGPGGGQPGQGQQGEQPSGLPTDRPSGAPSGMPSGGPGGGGMPGGVLPSGIDASAFQSANEACASLRPTGGPGGGGAGIDQSALAAYRSCLSDHGVTVTGRLDQLSTSDPKTAAALTTCAPLRPTPSGAPAGSASPSSSA